MRFLFLACDFPPAFGGIQKLSYGLCRELSQSGHDVTVIASAQPGDADFDDRSGLETIRCPVKGMTHGALSVGGAVSCSVRQSPPDAVIATKWAPEGPAYIRSRVWPGVPLILMGHGREFRPESHRPIRGCVQKMVIRAARGAVANSGYTASQMAAAGIPRERIGVVHPGIDPTEFGAVADLDEARRTLRWPEGPTLLSICRLIERKGIDTVIEAMPAVLNAHPQAHYVVIGGGPQEDALRELASTLGVAERVHFLGAVTDEQKAAALRLCTAFAMPSRDIPTQPPEGFGIVYLEANLCGKPVVAARTGGVEDAVVDGVTGILTDPGNPQQVAEAAGHLLSSPARAADMGDRGRRRTLERFTWPTIAPGFVEAVATIADRS